MRSELELAETGEREAGEGVAGVRRDPKRSTGEAGGGVSESKEDHSNEGGDAGETPNRRQGERMGTRSEE